MISHLKQGWATALLFLHRYPVATTTALLLGYLSFLQTPFTFSADTWAEGFIEYLSEALQFGWEEVVAPSWVGYLTILPSFLSKAFVNYAPIGYIDVFYRVVTVVFAVGCAAFVAHKFNRRLIKNDILRVVLALFFLMLLSDMSAFSFINVWYIGFVPLILIALNPKKLGILGQVGYVLFGALVALTKPSLVLAPFIVYRAIKTREYASNALVLVAVVAQTYYLFFGKNGEADAHVSSGLATVVSGVFTGVGVAFLKILAIFPVHFWYVVAAVACVGGLFALLLWARGIWVAGLVAFGLALSIYGHVLPPGGAIFGTWADFQSIYSYDFKSQREILVNAFLLLPIFLSLPRVLQVAKKRLKTAYFAGAVASVVLAGVGLGISLHRPIDTTSAYDISAYRHDLNTDQSVCVPLPVPAGKGGYDFNWLYQHYGGCVADNTKLTINPEFATDLPSEITVRGGQDRQIKSLLLLVKNPGREHQTITLFDQATGAHFSASVAPSINDKPRFILFNLANLAPRTSYAFTVESSSQSLVTSTFNENNQTVLYPYFMGYPNLGEKRSLQQR